MIRNRYFCQTKLLYVIGEGWAFPPIFNNNLNLLKLSNLILEPLEIQNSVKKKNSVVYLVIYYVGPSLHVCPHFSSNKKNNSIYQIFLLKTYLFHLTTLFKLDDIIDRDHTVLELCSVGTHLQLMCCQV